MSELKKCPFCGGEAAYTQILGNYGRPHEVYCSTCDGGITEGRSKDGVIHNWNNRPIENALTARIAELEAERDQAKAIVSRLRDFLFDYTQFHISTNPEERWWALVDKFDELVKEREE